MSITEDEIKKIPEGNCRCCRNYIRVNKKSYTSALNRIGFCLYGQMEGDYSLYYSYSEDSRCKGCVPSVDHYRIMMAEEQLRKDRDSFIEAMRDKRTKEYKMVQQMLASEIEIYNRNLDEKRKKKDPLGIWMDAHWRIEHTGNELFYDINIDRFAEVYKMVSLDKKDYQKFIAQVAIEIHNRFCDCDKLEFIIPKESKQEYSL